MEWMSASARTSRDDICSDGSAAVVGQSHRSAQRVATPDDVAPGGDGRRAGLEDRLDGGAV